MTARSEFEIERNLNVFRMNASSNSYRRLNPGAPLVARIGPFVVSVALLFSGCGGGGGSLGETPELAYLEGQKKFDEGRYAQAVRELQRVFEFGRVHDWADDAQFLMARSYYEDEQFLLSANEFDRFIGLYPSDERNQDAAYFRAMSYYRQSPEYNLDQTDTKRAVDYLRLFVTAYPNTEHAVDIGRKIDELQEKLALKLVATARLYERGGQFKAAALTYERVLNEYPSTSPVDEALFGAMKAYVMYADASVLKRQGERLRKAVDVYNQLYQLFPNSPYLKDAEEIYAGVAVRLEAFDG